MNNTSMTTMELKKINKQKVYQFIYQEHTTSKQLIARNLQMGLTTVTQNLKLLEEEGAIQRNGFFDSTGGRKADAIEIVRTARIAIGIALLKDMIEIVATDLYGTLLITKTYLLPYENNPSYYKDFSKHLTNFIEDSKWSPSQILGVSIATQGIISNDGTQVTYGALIHNQDMHLDNFTAYISYPCRLEHDSKATATLELWNHKEIEDAIVIILNHNLGGAIITGRKVHNGLHMGGGTIEHLCMEKKGPQCYCGRQGCLETYCSASSLEIRSQKNIPTFFHTLRNGDSESVSLWRDYLENLAFAIQNLNIIIDGKFIISGLLAPYLIEDDIAYLLEHVNQYTSFPLEKEDIILSTNKASTQALGASLSYIKLFLEII